MNTRTQFVGAAAIIVAMWLVSTPAAHALGFRNPDQNARATGQGEAFVAQADDASAIYYNPGGLTQVKGTQITSGGYVDFPSIHFKPGGGGSAEPDDEMFFLPHFYAATDFGLERWRFGLGFNVPFGNSIDWGKTFQYLVTKSDLVVYNIAPTIACQLNEHLSLGVGLNIYVANTTLEREVSPLLLPGGGHFRFHGESTSLGATVGSLWTINEHNSVGVVYRSPFTEDFAGTASLKGNPFGFDGHAPAHAGIRFPQSVAVGYALRPTRKLKLEVDVEWTNWDTLNTVVLHAPTSPLFNNTPTPFNWKDSFFYEFGAQYDLSERWAARAGYIFSENTVPSSSFSPVLPDSNRHVFSAGLGHVGKQMNVDVVYQYSLSTDRTIKGAGNPLAGEWSSSGHAVMFTSTLKF